MFATCIYNLYTKQTILTAAVKEGKSKGRFRVAEAKDMSGNQRVMSAKSPTPACNMGFSFWDRHKLSIITDIVIAILIVTTCVGVGYGCHLPLPAIWGITGSSLFGSALCLDAIGCKLNIIRLSNKIKEVVEATGTKDRIKTDDQL